MGSLARSEETSIAAALFAGDAVGNIRSETMWNVSGWQQISTSETEKCQAVLTVRRD